MVMFYIQYILSFLFLMTFYSGFGFPVSKDDVDDYEKSFQDEFDTLSKNRFLVEDGFKFQQPMKKSDSRPKYDPGWKFIGLGKRPESEEDLEYTPIFEDNKDGVNPLLGISTLINFEFFNAIKDGIEDAARETVKKEHFTGFRDSVSGNDDSGSLRYKSKLNLYGGRQKSMYDPGWMLTGLGK